MCNPKFVTVQATPLSLTAVLYLVYEEWDRGEDVGLGAGGENLTMPAARNSYPSLIT